MHVGLIGLGKMGFYMRERLRNGGVQNGYGLMVGGEEGRWTVEEAIANAMSALRHQFGGHAVEPAR